MGLDMYLKGRKFFWFAPPGHERRDDGKRVHEIIVDLGYWRKHPDLHGYIINAFAKGVDDCREIELTADRLRQIIDAVKAKKLPKTTGFFFGESQLTDDEIADDVKQLQSAIDWLEAGDMAPASFGEPVVLGAGFVAMPMQIDKSADQLAEITGKPKPEQQVTRSVFYQASW